MRRSSPPGVIAGCGGVNRTRFLRLMRPVRYRFSTPAAPLPGIEPGFASFGGMAREPRGQGLFVHRRDRHTDRASPGGFEPTVPRLRASDPCRLEDGDIGAALTAAAHLVPPPGVEPGATSFADSRLTIRTGRGGDELPPRQESNLGCVLRRHVPDRQDEGRETIRG